MSRSASTARAAIAAVAPSATGAAGATGQALATEPAGGALSAHAPSAAGGAPAAGRLVECCRDATGMDAPTADVKSSARATAANATRSARAGIGALAALATVAPDRAVLTEDRVNNREAAPTDIEAAALASTSHSAVVGRARRRRTRLSHRGPHWLQSGRFAA